MMKAVRSILSTASLIFLFGNDQQRVKQHGFKFICDSKAQSTEPVTVRSSTLPQRQVIDLAAS
jgi:hypothetical protein